MSIYTLLLPDRQNACLCGSLHMDVLRNPIQSKQARLITTQASRSKSAHRETCTGAKMANKSTQKRWQGFFAKSNRKLTSTFKDEHPLRNSRMLPKQSASVRGSEQY